MAYPSAIDLFTSPSGTSLLTSPDHANLHATAGSAITRIENTLGTTGGTALFNAYGLADKPAKKNNETFGTPSITGGTANGLTLGTPIIGTITVPGTTTALGFSAAITPGVGTITDVAGGTLTVNAQLGNVFYSAMGTAAGNRTIGIPQNPTGYQQITYAFKASGSANGTLVWASVFRFSQDSGTPALGTGTTWNYFGWRYNPIDTKYDFVGQSKNII